MINIDAAFSQFPAGRYRQDGPHSGQAFREDVLIPALREQQGVVHVSLDGTLGLGSSFLEEAFGGLVRAGYSASELHNRLRITCRLKSYESRAWQYIDEAAKKVTQ